jgi:MAF protein
MKLILGSSSPFRRKVFENAGIAFEVVKPDIDEKKIRAADHFLTPVILSYAKAQAVAAKVSEPAIIIACDQVIVCDGQIIEKPESPDEVRTWYKLYPKHPVQYVNGFTVYNTQTKQSLTAQEVAISTFKEIPDDFTEEQIKKGIIFNCAGGIGDETEDAYATIVQGSKESLIGLPVAFVMDMVERVK